MKSVRKDGRRKGRNTRPAPAAASPFSKSNVIAGVSGMGDLIDVRFRVTRAIKELSPALLIDEATGKTSTVGMVPRIGALMTHHPRVGGSGFLLFMNPDNVIKTGSLVTLVLGSYQKKHIRVA